LDIYFGNEQNHLNRKEQNSRKNTFIFHAPKEQIKA